jgi:hypothetical protein
VKTFSSVAARHKDENKKTSGFEHEGENLMQAKRIDLSAWLIGGEVVGATFGESPEVQKERLMQQIEKFFNHKGQIIALEVDTSHLHTNAHLEKGLDDPISWNETGIRFCTEYKVFEWLFDEGLINILVSDDVLSIIHDIEGGSNITQFVRW